MSRINIFVEGSDDVRFFQHTLVPVLRTHYDEIRLIPYASLRRVVVDRLIRGIERMGGEYVIVADIDAEPSVRSKKGVILRRYQRAEPGAIAVVVMEIESWYVAGADDDFLLGCGVTPFGATDRLTKEEFNTLIPRRYISRVEFMLDLLEQYSLDRGADRNQSLGFFLHRYAPEAVTIHK
ncbi:hypothetical protein DSECCO2_193480 [anaerobic digester metagenome]